MKMILHTMDDIDKKFLGVNVNYWHTYGVYMLCVYAYVRPHARKTVVLAQIKRKISINRKKQKKYKKNYYGTHTIRC